MAEIVRMPKLSDTMTEGVVAEWHKKVGDEVKSGELLAEIETDKATMEFESFQDGVLLHIGVETGKSAPVDAILAILGEKGEDVSAILEEDKKSSKSEEKAQPAEDDKKAAKEESPAKPVESKSSASPAKVSDERSSRAVSTPLFNSSAENGRIKASPLARKMAEERGVNLAVLKGTGEGGRVVKRDIEGYGGPAISGVESFEDREVSQMRKTIARRLAESKFSAPHFYLTIEINMEPAVQARESINAAIEPVKISFNDLVVKAAALSLQKHPQVNASWHGDFMRFNKHVHIGVAVAVDEGLLVPVVRFADQKTLTQIGGEVKEYAKKARDKKLQPQDWEGNTFTISNLGMFGIDEFTAIINPPDACILAVGAIVDKPVVKNGAVVPGKTMKVTLSCDHRIVDGAVGSAFLKTFRMYMENPVVMLGANNI